MENAAKGTDDSRYDQRSRLMEYAVGGCAEPEGDPSTAGYFLYARDKEFYCVASAEGAGERVSVMGEICCGRMGHEIRERGCRSPEDMEALVLHTDTFITEVKSYLSTPGRPGAPEASMVAAVLDRERNTAIVGCSGSASAFVLSAHARTEQGQEGGARGEAALYGLPSSSKLLGDHHEGDTRAACAASSVKLGTGDRLLLCSQEVSELLSSDLLIEILSSGGSPRSRAKRLAGLAAAKCADRPCRATAVVIDITAAGEGFAPIRDVGESSPDALEGEALAVLSEDGLALTFMRHRGGSLPDGLVFSGFEEGAPVMEPSQKPFAKGADTVRKVIFKDRIRPRSCAWWFCSFAHLEEVCGIDLLDTSRAQSMRGTFCGCRRLESLDLSSLDLAKARDMCGMFFGCESLKHLNLWKMPSPEARSLSLMFKGCSSLHAIDLSKMEAHHVEDARSLLEGCSSLEEADLSGISFAPHAAMDSMLATDGSSGFFADADEKTFRLKRIVFGPDFRFWQTGVLPVPVGDGATGCWCWLDESHAMSPRQVEQYVNGCSERTVWVLQEGPYGQESA